MPSWLLKSFVQRAISVLPRPQKWNELFQKHVTKSLGLTEGHCAGMVALARRHLDVRWRHSLPENFTVFEVGTGWYPVAPVVAILCGADKVWTFDIDPLLSAERLERMLGHLRRFAADGRLGAFLPNLQKNRLSILDAPTSGDPVARLREMGIEYRLQDASTTALPSGAVDHFLSHSVMQYIPRAPLETLMREFARIAKPNATHSHHILLKDQFSIFDRSISEFDFMRFSDGAWRWLDSPLIPQTRLRIRDYREAFAAAGWKMLAEHSEDGNAAALKRVKLDPRFRDYSEADLLVVSTWVELGN